MDFEKLIRTEKFLEEMSVSIRNILLAQFPELTSQDKEDIDHEVKLKIWRKLARGKKISNLRSYLWKVVYTTALDMTGEKLNVVSLDNCGDREGKGEISSQEMLSPESHMKIKENELMIDKTLNTLSEKRKAVLKLHFSGKNIKQIAACLGWRENQVRHLLYRGLGDLKQKLGGQKG
ncbi:MAG: sigma-70 family RNA polymerase sigma factor [Clostridiales bacterium]|nr:sigma-70 family RNA polymerase sigma factor [Clostridiales bacterium]